MSGLSEQERETLIVAVSKSMHHFREHPDYPDYDEPACSAPAVYHDEARHERGRRGVCWACEPMAAAVVDNVLADAVAAAREEAATKVEALARNRRVPWSTRNLSGLTDTVRTDDLRVLAADIRKGADRG